MPKVIINGDDIQRVGTASRLIEFQLDLNAYDNISSDGQISFLTSPNASFTSAQSNPVTSYESKPTADGTWASVSGNVIQFANQSKYFRITLPGIAAESLQYVKVVFTVGAKVFQSEPILFSSNTIIDFKLQTPIIVGTSRPYKVKVTDKIRVSVQSPMDILVEVTNNANDTTPVWENATTDYLNGDYHTFTNNTRVNGNPWAISVHYHIKKNNPSDIIEVSELYLAFV